MEKNGVPNPAQIGSNYKKNLEISWLAQAFQLQGLIGPDPWLGYSGPVGVDISWLSLLISTHSHFIHPSLLGKAYCYYHYYEATDNSLVHCNSSIVYCLTCTYKITIILKSIMARNVIFHCCIWLQFSYVQVINLHNISMLVINLLTISTVCWLSICQLSICRFSVCLVNYHCTAYQVSIYPLLTVTTACRCEEA